MDSSPMLRLQDTHRSEFLNHEVEPCDICSDVGFPELIVTCSKCNISREHVYCMRINLREIPEDWICESCQPSPISISSSSGASPPASLKRKGTISNLCSLCHGEYDLMTVIDQKLRSKKEAWLVEKARLESEKISLEIFKEILHKSNEGRTELREVKESLDQAKTSQGEGELGEMNEDTTANPDAQA